MNITIDHQEALITVEDINSESRQISVEMKDSSVFAPSTKWVTRYPVDLIEAILKIKGAAWLCDEIERDENPAYTASDIHASIFGYIAKSEMEGKRILDFGCGSGASTMILSRLLPNSHIYGIELEKQFLAIAQRRAEFYKAKNVTLLLSPSEDRLPDEIQEVDYILLSAVYEHLLPEERPALLLQMWERLTANGILFINQTPDRRFPLETHTTGLPFINYLPNSITCLLARKLSSRNLQDKSWKSLLRAGIRGATPAEIIRFLSKSSYPPLLLKPKFNGFQRQNEIWYKSAKERLSQRFIGFKKKIILGLMDFIVFLRLPIAPYLSLAIQKRSR